MVIAGRQMGSVVVFRATEAVKSLMVESDVEVCPLDDRQWRGEAFALSTLPHSCTTATRLQLEISAGVCRGRWIDCDAGRGSPSTGFALQRSPDDVRAWGSIQQSCDHLTM